MSISHRIAGIFDASDTKQIPKCRKVSARATNIPTTSVAYNDLCTVRDDVAPYNVRLDFTTNL